MHHKFVLSLLPWCPFFFLPLEHKGPATSKFGYIIAFMNLSPNPPVPWEDGMQKDQTYMTALTVSLELNEILGKIAKLCIFHCAMNISNDAVCLLQ
jgi:hypothetical protein